MNKPLSAEAESYLVSTLGLEPEHFHLVTRTKLPAPHTHDWHVQPSCQRPNRLIRLSGAASVQRNLKVRADTRHSDSFCPRNLFTLPAAAQSCQPVALTGFPPVLHMAGSSTQQTAEAFCARQNASSAPPKQCLFGTCRGGSSQFNKDRLEVLAIDAEPFEELCPRMQTPWPGSIL